MRLQFLGANRQVTGSRYLLEAGGLKVMVDCGLFQERAYLERNWAPSPVSPEEIDVLLLTHAHLDHSGLIPKLVKAGFNGSILTTPASADLARIVLLDSARIQEEDAAYKKKRHRREKRRGAHPEIPLYEEEDARQALSLFKEVDYDTPTALNKDVEVVYREAGHILGSALLEINVREKGLERRIVFSGDIGQYEKPLMRPPASVRAADYVVMESTYGDRNHRDEGDVGEQLCDVVNQTLAAGGNLIIPTFAIERAQELLFYLSRLVWQKRFPHLMAFLDSPMAVNATEVFQRHIHCLDEEIQQALLRKEDPFEFPGLKLVRTRHDSMAINRIAGTCIIMAGSGMCTGGRIKHHLVHNISRRESTILFVGFQSKGTLGRQIVEGRPEVRIHGRPFKVRAQIRQIQGFSAHADQQDLMQWLGHFDKPPRQVFLCHGEEEAALTLEKHIERLPGWNVEVPAYQQAWDLD